MRALKSIRVSERGTKPSPTTMLTQLWLWYDVIHVVQLTFHTVIKFLVIGGLCPQVMLRGGRQSADFFCSLQWRHNGHESVTNHQPHHCLLSRLFRRKSKKTSKVRVTGLCTGNSPVTCEFQAQMASNAENISSWWRHHVLAGLVSNSNNALWITLALLENDIDKWQWQPVSVVSRNDIRWKSKSFLPNLSFAQNISWDIFVAVLAGQWVI